MSLGVSILKDNNGNGIRYNSIEKKKNDDL